MSAFIGLYYPFASFRSDSWLKLSALYWDKMARILPRHFPIKSDSLTVKELVHDGFVENIDPYAELPQLYETFSMLLRVHGDKLRERYGVDKRESWPDYKMGIFWDLPGADPKLAYAYVDKIGWMLFSDLVQAGLALTHRFEWVGMHPRLADVYMIVLAEHISASHRFSPVADEAINHLAVSGCTSERVAKVLLENLPLSEGPSNTEVEVTMATMAIQSVIPKRLTDLPASKIIEFRKHHSSELAAFQKSMKEFSLAFCKEAPAKGFEAHIEAEFRKSIQPRVDDLRKALNGLAIETVHGVLGVTMTLPEALAATGLIALNPVLGGITAFAYNAIPFIRDKQKAARAMAQGPEAYLLGLEENLSPKTLSENIKTKARRFVLGV